MAIRRSLLAALLASCAAGCGLVFGVGDYHVATESGDEAGLPETGTTDGPGSSDGPSSGCTTNAQCSAQATQEGPIDAGPDVDAAAQIDDSGVIPAVCVKATGTCQRLFTAECTSVTGNWKNDDSVLLGTMFATVGATAKTNIARQQSALLAVEEINSTLGGGGLPPVTSGGPVRPLAVLSCQTATSLSNAGKHLVDELHVAGIVGPNLTQDTIDLATTISVKGGTLIMSPAATSSAVAGLADDGLVWTSIPSDVQRAKLVVKSINDDETALHATRGATLKLAIVYRDDAFGQSTFSSISGSLTFNAKLISDAANAPYVKSFKYPATGVPGQNDVAAAVATFKPDVVAVFGTSESVTNVLLPLEVDLETADPSGAVRPSYVLIDPNKVKELTDGLAGPGISTVSPLRTRVRGVGTIPEEASVPVFAAFNNAYVARYGDNPHAPSMGPSYDTMYAMAFAIVATSSEPVTGKSIGKGLAGLGSGTEVELGRASTLSAFQKLIMGQAVNPIGTFSHLKWDGQGTITTGNLEVWCIGLAAGAPTYESSGITMGVTTQSVQGTYTPCN